MSAANQVAPSQGSSHGFPQITLGVRLGEGIGIGQIQQAAICPVNARVGDQSLIAERAIVPIGAAEFAAGQQHVAPGFAMGNISASSKIVCLIEIVLQRLLQKIYRPAEVPEPPTPSLIAAGADRTAGIGVVI